MENSRRRPITVPRGIETSPFMARLKNDEAARELRRRELRSTIGGFVLLILAGVSVVRSLYSESFDFSVLADGSTSLADKSVPSQFDPACNLLREMGDDELRARCVMPNMRSPQDIVDEVDEIEAAQEEAWGNLPKDFPRTR